ncbi:hypothetical protein Xoosp14_110 [Xanthomonas phage Xoo-sp14]|nr:hypothetical protein Xoosp14_110 [Xanthomonas phage Xoo-sp14]
MAIFFMTGFDLFGSADNSSKNGPLLGAGLINHPSKPTIGNTALKDHSIGVSTLDRYMMGKGANRRKAVTWWAGEQQMNGTVAATFPLPVGVAGTNGQRTTFGFRLKKQKINPAGAALPNVWYSMLSINGSVYLAFSPGANTLYFGVSSNAFPYVFVDGQEYYIELSLVRTGTSTHSFELYIDGVKVGATFSTSLTGPFTTFALGSGGSNYIWNMAVSYSDVYVSDTKLGPQMVISRQPTLQLVKNWTPSEGEDNLALITGANTMDDGKIISSPDLGNLSDRYRLEFNLPSHQKAYAASLFVRGKRDQASTRRVLATVFGPAGTTLDPDKRVNTLFDTAAFRTDLLWSTEDQSVLTPANLAGLEMTLVSPLS